MEDKEIPIPPEHYLALLQARTNRTVWKYIHAARSVDVYITGSKGIIGEDLAFQIEPINPEEALELFPVKDGRPEPRWLSGPELAFLCLQKEQSDAG